MKVIVKRAFLIRGERQEVGAVIEVDGGFGRELIAMQKVAPAELLAPQTGPMTTESASAFVAGRKRKEQRNAD